MKRKQRQECKILVYDKKMNILSPTNSYIANTLVLRDRAKWLEVDKSIILLKSKNDFKKLKSDVIKLENRICYICKEQIPKDINATIDHVEPKSKFGKDSKENLRCCCKRCNDDKGSRSFTEYYKYILRNSENYRYLDFKYLKTLNNNRGLRHEICYSSQPHNL